MFWLLLCCVLEARGAHGGVALEVEGALESTPRLPGLCVAPPGAVAAWLSTIEHISQVDSCFFLIWS